MISHENMFQPFQSREEILAGMNPPAPQMYGPGGSPDGSGLGQAQQINPLASVQPGGLFYRGGGEGGTPRPNAAAPIRSQPARETYGSAYAPQAAAPVKPNAPKPSVPGQNPYAGIGDVRGNEMGEFKGGSVGVDQKGLGSPRTPSDIDYERRRAFLDAPDSLSGMKAVKALQERRRRLTIELD